MRKSFWVIVFLLIFAAGLAGEDKFFVSAGAAAAVPGNSRYRDFYGTVQFSPELKAGITFFKSLYAWLGCSFFSARYPIPDLVESSRGTQQFLSLGVGWETRRGRRLQSDFFAALVLAGYRETALGATDKGSALGFELGTGLRYFFSKRVFMGVAFAFSQARVSSPEAGSGPQEGDLLGSLRLVTSLGVRF